MGWEWAEGDGRTLVVALKPFRDEAIGPLIVAAAIVGWLLAIALLIYIAT
jgi:hypothetical protein